MSLGKLPGGVSPDTFGEVIPDLAVEVLSPSDSLRELGRKIGEFLDNGIPLVWLVDPARQTVTVQQLGLNDTADPILPGFSVPIRRFF